MKRILSLIIVATVLLSALSISAFAQENEEDIYRRACYRINWSTQSFYTYWYTTQKTDANYTKYFNVETSARHITSEAHSGTTDHRRAYFSQQMFEITDTTYYEYTFKARNNQNYAYTGIVFAFGDGLPYLMYGSFNNVADYPNDGMCDVRLRKGLNQSDDLDCETGFTRHFLKVDVDSDNCGHFKIVYKGYEVSVYGLVNREKGIYVKIGETITLPSGSKVALGVYGRDRESGWNRTIYLSDCLLYAMNKETEQILAPFDDGSCELVNLIEKAKNDYLEIDYTPDTFRELQRAIEDAEDLLDSWVFTDQQLTDAKEAIEEAIDQLELAPVDFTKLLEAIAAFEALNPAEYTAISYRMVEEAVEAGRPLIDKVGVKQSEVNSATALILDRMAALVPSGYIAPQESDTYYESSTASSESVDNLEDLKSGCKGCKGCGSSAAISAVILVGIMGTALVIKKKED